jgi:hypothetical protein
MRALPPVLTLLPSPHSIRLPNRSSATGVNWQPFLDLKLMFAGSRRAEQLSLRSQQRIMSIAEDSVLRAEMAGLESQEEDAPKRILFYKPMS